ncbi:hypothetical protein BGW80DRAFT_788517 [Lactifluus volemus]|nr:hypothetical protein BGW80DRAFT_788517 [Lactifluus volemus]
MAKPLYKRADDSVYLVISQPFGMKPSPAERGTMDIGRLASWISWVFRKQSVVDIVYTMSTKDEVIVKISEGVDRDRILGKHRYNDIVSTGWPQDRSFASCVFEYNYQDNGDPAEHNWREYVPSDASAPPGLFRDPCPAPTWIARPPYLANLAHHLPESLPRTPKRSPEPFYQASSHARGENVKQEQNYSLHATAPSSDFVPGPVKVEPYGRTSVQSQQTGKGHLQRTVYNRSSKEQQQQRPMSRPRH